MEKPIDISQVDKNFTSDTLKILDVSLEQHPPFPFFHDYVSAGFPSPAQHEMEKKCDLHSLLVKHPASTFFVRASGSSMIGAGIHHNDILVVDRSIPPAHGKVVIAALDGELTVKRLVYRESKIFLIAENPDYPMIEISENMELHVWGVVTNVIHSL